MGQRRQRRQQFQTVPGDPTAALQVEFPQRVQTRKHSQPLIVDLWTACKPELRDGRRPPIDMNIKLRLVYALHTSSRK